LKNKTSTYIIVSFSLFVGLLHFLIGPDYQGVLRNFFRGYLIDILLPMNLYLLLQIALRKHLPVTKARVLGAAAPFLIGLTAEMMQFFKISFLGSTYDLLDILMYALGIGAGVVVDLTILDRLEERKQEV